MRPISLTLENVFQYVHYVFQFKLGITGITGRNGSGKSNLLEALYFSISGKTNDMVKEGLLNWNGATTGKTVYRFEHGGQIYDLTRNVHNSGVKMESEAFEKPLRGAEANAFMQEALGTTFEGFYETCWSPQGSLLNILIIGHAQRVAFFQKLSNIREAESIRGILQDALGRLPNYIDRTESMQNLTEMMGVLTEEISAAQEVKANLEHLSAAYAEMQTDVQKILSLLTEDQYKGAIDKADADMTVAQITLDTFETQNLIEDIQEVLPVGPEMVVAKEASEEQARLITRQTADKAVLENLKQQAIPKVVSPTGLLEHVKTLSQELTDSTPKYNLAVSGNCPTCDRPYDLGGEEARKKIIEDHERLYVAHREYAKELADLEAEYSEYLQKEASHSTKVSATEDSLNGVTAQLQAMGEISFDLAVYNAQILAHSEYVEKMQRKEHVISKLSALQRHLDSCKAILETAMKTPYAAKEKIQEAQEFIVNQREIQDKLLEGTDRLAGHISRKIALEDQFAAMQEEQQKRQTVAKVRHLFERSREVLHRDNLPRLAMQKLLFGLNTLLDQYLCTFETNFTAYINSEFDFMVNFDAKSDVPARTLSGGQKVALALAFKFAVSDLLASSVPMMILDEPTVWLDDINKPRLAEVFSKAREVTEKGVYVLVATHETILFPSFSRIADVGEKQ